MDLNHPFLASFGDEPPPFPDNHPQLQRLDRSVVCQICKELFQAPVVIACGHSFCSECIRSSLGVMTDKKCPLCHATVAESSIRRNRALEEITDAWDAARPTMITLTQPVAGPSRRRPPPEPTSKASSADSVPGKRVRPRDGSRSQSPVKIRKVEDTDVMEILASSDYEPEEDDEMTENDEGACPICQARLAIASIPMHIERGCPPPKQPGGNQKADWKKVFSTAGAGKEKITPMKRITKPNYHLASPADLRAILTEYSLPTIGDKPVLQARVQQWIVMYNSNLDTEHPRSLSALRAKLNETEASRKRDKERGRDEAVQKLGTKEGFDQYVKTQESEFERLRRDIIDRRNKAESKPTKGLGVDTAIEVD